MIFESSKRSTVKCRQFGYSGDKRRGWTTSSITKWPLVGLAQWRFIIFNCLMYNAYGVNIWLITYSGISSFWQGYKILSGSMKVESISLCCQGFFFYKLSSLGSKQRQETCQCAQMLYRMLFFAVALCNRARCLFRICLYIVLFPYFKSPNITNVLWFNL